MQERAINVMDLASVKDRKYLVSWIQQRSGVGKWDFDAPSAAKAKYFCAHIISHNLRRQPR